MPRRSAETKARVYVCDNNRQGIFWNERIRTWSSSKIRLDIVLPRFYSFRSSRMLLKKALFSIQLESRSAFYFHFATITRREFRESCLRPPDRARVSLLFLTALQQRSNVVSVTRDRVIERDYIISSFSRYGNDNS